MHVAIHWYSDCRASFRCLGFAYKQFDLITERFKNQCMKGCVLSRQLPRTQPPELRPQLAAVRGHQPQPGRVRSGETNAGGEKQQQDFTFRLH